MALLEKAAVDESHTPAVYAVFIKSLISSMGFEGRAASAVRLRASRPAPDHSDAIPLGSTTLEHILDVRATDSSFSNTSSTLNSANPAATWDPVSACSAQALLRQDGLLTYNLKKLPTCATLIISDRTIQVLIMVF